MSKELKKVKIAKPRHKDAFLLYFNLGAERSLVNVRQKLSKKGIKISETSLAKWSKEFKWVERVQTMDQEVYDKAEELAIKNATMKKSEILKACQDTMLKYVKALNSGKLIPTATDFRKMWEIARMELGKPIGQEALIAQGPAINIFLTKSEKIIKVVQESQTKLREALEGEIKEEK